MKGLLLFRRKVTGAAIARVDALAATATASVPSTGAGAAAVQRTDFIRATPAPSTGDASTAAQRLTTDTRADATIRGPCNAMRLPTLLVTDVGSDIYSIQYVTLVGLRQETSGIT